jgi:NodT family efflux transporter outer membrane factor (OMF) lipoprotein
MAAGVLAAALALAGCALQPAYTKPDMRAPADWSADVTAARQSSVLMVEDGWHTLGDPAIDALADAAFADNPTLVQAMARVDEARASLDGNAATKAPTVGVSAAATRAQNQNISGPTPDTTVPSTSAQAGASLSWEVDLFGRVRQSVEAAQSRLDARAADAALARLSLGADVATTVLSLRACDYSRRVLEEDIASREKTLALTRLRLKTGFAAPVDEARAASGIASQRTSLATRKEQCARQVNALVALSGKNASTVRELVDSSAAMPQAPAAVPELPATVLARHPGVVSAEREVAAAYADVGVARANRLPRLDLAAALTGNWIRAAGSTLDFSTWSIGPSVTGMLFDNGAGAANVSAAEARYRRAVASMQSTLRVTVQDVENALAAQTSAQARLASSAEATAAARTTLTASEAQWKAGSVSLFELEDSRRQLASAQDAEISARRDQAQAWVSLVKATGGALFPTSESTHHE